MLVLRENRTEQGCYSRLHKSEMGPQSLPGPEHTCTTTYKLRGTFFRERVREGKWTIVGGPKTSPNAVVYQLDPDKPQGSLFLLKADSNILFSWIEIAIFWLDILTSAIP